MFPVIYGWDESAAVRDYARAVGLPENEPVCVWLSYSNFGVLKMDILSVGGFMNDELKVFPNDRPDVDSAQLRREVVDYALEKLPELGVDTEGVMNALDAESGCGA